MIELFNLRERNIDLCFAGLAALRDEIGQTMQRLRAKHDIHIGRAFDNRRAFLTGDAAAHAN